MNVFRIFTMLKVLQRPVTHIPYERLNCVKFLRLFLYCCPDCQSCSASGLGNLGSNKEIHPSYCYLTLVDTHELLVNRFDVLVEVFHLFGYQ